MAGTVVCNTINTDTGLFSTNNAYLGVSKAWVNFLGDVTPTIRSSFNVSSVTRVTTGTWTINFATAMTDANYVVVGSGYRVAGTYVAFGVTYGTQTTTTCPVQTISDTGAVTDVTVASFAILGN